MDHMDERLQGVRVCNQLDIYLTRWWRMTGWSWCQACGERECFPAAGVLDQWSNNT